MQVLERQTLVDVTGGDGRPAAVSDTAFARIAHDYPPDLLAEIHAQSMQLRQSTRSRGRRFLGLDHLRRVQETIPQVKELVHDRQRLDELCGIAGVELEPYPIGTSCSGINFYWPGQQPIEFHCDGPAFVELVPLYVDGHQEGGSTVAFRGPPDAGRLLAQDRIPDDQLLRIPQRAGSSVLLQGRMLLHTAETLTDGHRVTLVMSLRSKAQPWKDGNTLARLLEDDAPQDVEPDWRRDVQTRQLPALQSFLLSELA